MGKKWTKALINREKTGKKNIWFRIGGYDLSVFIFMTELSDKTEQKQSRTRGLRPFKKGQSGNPAGRPRGSISITTKIKERLDELLPGRKEKYLDHLITRFFIKWQN